MYGFLLIPNTNVEKYYSENENFEMKTGETKQGFNLNWK